MADYFLQVKKSYYKLCEEKTLGIDATDIMILAQIEEFQRNRQQCYIKDETFSNMLGISRSTVKRRIRNLSRLGFIHRDTTTMSKRGQASKQRFLTVNCEAIQTAIENIERRQCKNCPKRWTEQSSISSEAEIKSSESKGQDERIKDNKKDNEKDNINSTERVVSGNMLEEGFDADICIDLTWDDGQKHAPIDDQWYFNGHLPNEDELWRELDIQQKRCG